MDNGSIVRLEAADDYLDAVAAQLPPGASERAAGMKSISSLGNDGALLIDLAKAAIPLVSGAIAVVATKLVGRSAKLNGMEFRGYSADEIIKLLVRLKKLNEPGS